MKRGRSGGGEEGRDQAGEDQRASASSRPTLADFRGECAPRRQPRTGGGYRVSTGAEQGWRRAKYRRYQTDRGLFPHLECHKCLYCQGL
jgi:hypothetical protein